MTNEERARLFGLVSKFSSDLGEHFDCVQIMASFVDEQGTSSFYSGAGDWFARQGLAQDFIVSNTAELTGRSVAKELNK